jgi:hypothetical protein
MKLKLSGLIAAILVTAGVHAAVVFTQPLGGGLLPSSWWTPNGSDYDQYAWDNFSLASNTPVTEVQWQGGFGYGGSGGTVTGFTISFYSSIGGNSQPNIATAAPLATYTVSGNAGQTSAGTIGGVAYYNYDCVLPTPFQATADSVYWIQIEAAQAGIPDWGIAGGSGGNGSYFRRFAYVGDLYFTMGPGDAAFTLLTADTAIYSVAAKPSPVASGTITGTGLFPTGMTASLVATPATNFAFVNWTQDGAVESFSANYSFTVASNRILAANFAAGSSITTQASPASGGAVTGGGSYTNGASVTVTATTNANYNFVNWTENGTPVSVSPSYTFAVSSNRALTANFSSATVNPAVYYSQPPAPGTGLILSSFLSPDGMDGDNYCYDDFVLPVTQDITEIRWFGTYQYGNLVSDFTIRIYSSITGGSQPDIGSVYAANPLKSYTVGGNAGETFTNGMFAYDFVLPSSLHAVAGTRYWVQIEASQTSYPNGWSFIHGSGGNGRYFVQVTGASASLAAGDASFMLIGAAGTNCSTITTLIQPAGGGSTSGDGAFANGLTNAVSALPANGFAFLGWSSNGVTVSTNATYSFAVTTNLTLSAIFSPLFTVSIAASPAAGGTVAGAGTYSALTSVSVAAHTNAGYNFVNWTEGGVPVSAATNYNFTVVATRALVANFAAIPVPMTASNLSGTGFSFSWNSAAPGWVLQESPDLVLWTNSTRTLTTNGTQRGVTVSPVGGNDFFRLYHP